MSIANSTHVVSARPAGAASVVYFDGAGQWTADLRKAQIARSATGRKAMLRVAAALANGSFVNEPRLTEVTLSPPVVSAAL